MSSFTLEEIQKHSSDENAWIVHGGRVFDVTDFVSRHPGGRDVLQGNFGKDVTETMNDSTVHKHSATAYNMLKKYSIGKLISKVGFIRIEISCNVSGNYQ